MEMLDEIVKCSSCRKILTRKQFDGHKCEIPWKSTKEIAVLYWLNCSTDESQKMLGVGLDGTRYFLVVKKPEAIPFIKGIFPSDGFLQGNKSDEDFTEPFFIILI